MRWTLSERETLINWLFISVYLNIRQKQQKKKKHFYQKGVGAATAYGTSPYSHLLYTGYTVQIRIWLLWFSHTSQHLPVCQKTAAPVTLFYKCLKKKKKGMQRKCFCAFNITNMLHCPVIFQEQLSHLFNIKKKKQHHLTHKKLVIFSISSSLCLCDTFSYAFSADICLALEAVIIAGSVKENSCSNMLLLSVVTGKMLFRYRIGIFKSCLTQQCLSSGTVEPSLQMNFSRNTLMDSLENKLCDK